jgi:hypothetical protein
MKRTLIAAAAICLAVSGSALAQNSNATPSKTGATTGADYMSDPAMVGGFYTDDTMSTLRPVEEMRTAFMAMSADEQAALKLQCEQEENRGTDGTALCSEVANF